MGTPEQELKTLLLSEEIELLERLRTRLQEIDLRVGDDTRLQQTVGNIIVDVLAEAGVQDHRRLARVISPLIVSSIRQEITNSTDVMVDALYPITGRLVTTAVRKAFRELLDTVNDRLTGALTMEMVRVRVRAKLTGRPESEVWLEQRGFFVAEEAYLIDAQSGILLARAERGSLGAGAIDEDLVAGMLSAILSFSQEAFAQNPEALRRLEFDGSDLLICRSPAYVLAIRVMGIPPAGLDNDVEACFQDVMDRWRSTLNEAGGVLDDPTRGSLTDDLKNQLENLSQVERHVKRTPYLAYGLLFALFFGIGTWIVMGYLVDREVAKVVAQAEAVIEADPRLQGYPIDVAYDPDQKQLSATDLVPNPIVHEELRRSMQGTFQDKQINLDLTPVRQADLAVFEGLLRDLAAERQDPVLQLHRWAAENAIFFGDDTAFRDPAVAETKLDTLASLIKMQPLGVIVRVIGYGDMLGGQAINRSLTVERADRVVAQLVERGVARDRLVAVGRAQLNLLSPVEGPGSPNRRVEFEVGFFGEVEPQP